MNRRGALTVLAAIAVTPEIAKRADDYDRGDQWKVPASRS